MSSNKLSQVSSCFGKTTRRNNARASASRSGVMVFPPISGRSAVPNSASHSVSRLPLSMNWRNGHRSRMRANVLPLPETWQRFKVFAIFAKFSARHVVTFSYELLDEITHLSLAFWGHDFVSRQTSCIALRICFAACFCPRCHPSSCSVFFAGASRKAYDSSSKCSHNAVNSSSHAGLTSSSRSGVMAHLWKWHIILGVELASRNDVAECRNRLVVFLAYLGEQPAISYQPFAFPLEHAHNIWPVHAVTTNIARTISRTMGQGECRIVIPPQNPETAWRRFRRRLRVVRSPYHPSRLGFPASLTLPHFSEFHPYPLSFCPWQPKFAFAHIVLPLAPVVTKEAMLT